MPSSLPEPVVAFFKRGSGAATRQALVAQGVTDNDLRRWVRSGLVIRVRDGAYALPPRAMPPGFASDHGSLAAVLLAGPDVVISHRSAAPVHGLPVVGNHRVPEATRDETGAHIAGVRLHRYGVRPADVVVVGGLRVTTPARTVVDLCRVTPFAEALMACDVALGRGQVTREQLFAVLEALGDINYRRRAGDVITAGDPLAESPLESRSRGVLLANGVPVPQLQWWVGDGNNLWFRPDMLWWLWGIVGEVDGRSKYRDPSALWHEKQRQEWMENQGLAVVRWTDSELRLSSSDIVRRWEAARARQLRVGWKPPEGLWLVTPGPWPASRPFLRNSA